MWCHPRSNTNTITTEEIPFGGAPHPPLLLCSKKGVKGFDLDVVLKLLIEEKENGDRGKKAKPEDDGGIMEGEWRKNELFHKTYG
jgi:hypothetical protein